MLMRYQVIKYIHTRISQETATREDNRLWRLYCKVAESQSLPPTRLEPITSYKRLFSKDMLSLLTASWRTLHIIDIIRHSSV